MRVTDYNREICGVRAERGNTCMVSGCFASAVTSVRVKVTNRMKVTVTLCGECAIVAKRANGETV